jgi:hypothetical protein
MTVRARLERIDEDHESPFQRRTVCERLQDYRQLAWLACATTSLLTTRHLLIERNLHYPLQLYITQIAATAVVAFVLYPWRSNIQETSEHAQRRTQPLQGALLLAASNLLQAVSAFCITQAVLHTSNLPLLCMITVCYLNPSSKRAVLTMSDHSLLRRRFRSPCVQLHTSLKCGNSVSELACSSLCRDSVHGV